MASQGQRTAALQEGKGIWRSGRRGASAPAPTPPAECAASTWASNRRPDHQLLEPGSPQHADADARTRPAATEQRDRLVARQFGGALGAESPSGICFAPRHVAATPLGCRARPGAPVHRRFARSVSVGAIAGVTASAPRRSTMPRTRRARTSPPRRQADHRELAHRGAHARGVVREQRDGPVMGDGNRAGPHRGTSCPPGSPARRGWPPRASRGWVAGPRSVAAFECGHDSSSEAAAVRGSLQDGRALPVDDASCA